LGETASEKKEQPDGTREEIRDLKGLTGAGQRGGLEEVKAGKKKRKKKKMSQGKGMGKKN